MESRIPADHATPQGTFFRLADLALRGGRAEQVPATEPAIPQERSEAVRAPSQDRLFRIWLTSSFKAQTREVADYLTTSPDVLARVVAVGTHTFQEWVPDSVSPQERSLFHTQLRAVFIVLGINAPSPIAFRIIQQITETPRERRLRLEPLSSALQVSIGHLSRRFRCAVGVSMRRYALMIRMCDAAEELRTSPVPVKQVAAAMGYKDVGNFSRDFRTVFGMGTREFRRLMRAQRE